MSITRNEIQPQRGSADLRQVAQDLADLIGLGDYGKNPDQGAASAAGQRIDRGAQPSYTWAISLAQVDRLSLSETFSGGIAHHLLDGTNAIVSF